MNSKVRIFFYKYLPKWNWLQWIASLLIGINYQGQRKKAKQPLVCMFACIALVVIGIKMRNIFLIKTGIQGGWLLKEQFSKWFWIKSYLLVLFLLL
jgi:hypothetical protein